MTRQDSILSVDSLEAVRRHIESAGSVAVLHWHLFGASHPTSLAFSDFETFSEYLRCSTKPGDAIDVWPFPVREEDRIAGGKIPNSDGTVHQGGAY